MERKLCTCSHFEDDHPGPWECDGSIYDADGEEWNCPCNEFVPDTA